MDNSEDFFPDIDPQQLLKKEVQLLGKRVDALIKWTEDFEDSVVFFGKKDVNNKEEKSNFECAAGNEMPSLVMVEKLDEKEEDSMPGERKTNTDPIEFGWKVQDQNPDEKGETDLFGASCSFGELKGNVEVEVEKETKTSTENNISLLEWDY